MTDDRPSATASLIARSLILLAEDPETAALVPHYAAAMSGWFLAEAAGTLSRGEGKVRLWRSLCRLKPFRELIYGIESRALPGILFHYALRKRFIEASARRFLGANPDGRIVVLGAGFDTLAIRLCREYLSAEFLELDHPATQVLKRNALLRRHPVPPNLTMRSANLADRPQFPASDRPTFFVAEGLLMYLPLPSVGDLFKAAASSQNTEFVFTFLEPHPADGVVGFARKSPGVDAWLRRRSEPFRWGIRREELADWLPSVGWLLRGDVKTPEGLRAAYLPANSTRGRLNVCGDLIATAELGRSKGGPVPL